MLVNQPQYIAIASKGHNLVVPLNLLEGDMVGNRFIIYYKAPETYVYRFDEESRATLTQLLCKQAADPRLNLSWFDAALIVRTAKDVINKRYNTIRF